MQGRREEEEGLAEQQQFQLGRPPVLLELGTSKKYRRFLQLGLLPISATRTCTV